MLGYNSQTPIREGLRVFADWARAYDSDGVRLEGEALCRMRVYLTLALENGPSRTRSERSDQNEIGPT